MKTFRKKLLGKASAKKPLRKTSAKAQSAMEYLMTYSWAILIIAVVLAALFQLGVFNPMSFAPKAPPGSCQVFRPNGPYTTSFINLEGICSGELPQYVAQFNGQWSSGPYNSNSVIFAPSEPISGTNVIFTIAMWVKPSSVQNFSHSQNTQVFSLEGFQAFGIRNSCLPNTCLVLIRCTSADTGSGALLPYSIFNNEWYFIAVSVNPPNYYWYINGVSSADTNGNTYTSSPGATIGTQFATCYSNAFNGSIANVQLYNTSLSANEIQALYLEGIGGAPINLQHLVAWWPLNGNANDYSGNGNNGQASNVNFVSNWYSGYTPP